MLSTFMYFEIHSSSVNILLHAFASNGALRGSSYNGVPMHFGFIGGAGGGGGGSGGDGSGDDGGPGSGGEDHTPLHDPSQFS